MRFSFAALSSVLLASSAVLATTPLKNHADQFRKRMDKYGPKPRTIEEKTPLVKRSSNERKPSPYATDRAQHFVVNSTGFPDIPFDIGESYAGLLPISDDPYETRKLFFWFFPSENPAASKEITIWFNGGPGCSSLSGFLTENGKFTWQAGTLAPVENPYSWTNLTNVMWVEQPVGVGFTQGVPNITNEVELGLEFIGFYKQFVDTFNAHGNKVYLTGESYGGFYVPYIADAFITANDTDYYNLKGIAINDPIIGDFAAQEVVVAVPYADYWDKIFFLNETHKQGIHEQHEVCGFAEYMDKYFRFPPPQEAFVLPAQLDNETLNCDTFDTIYTAALAVNPCFNIYHITETCPHPYSQLGIVNAGDYNPPNAVSYFNRTDVQAALNAPIGTNWQQCTATVNVFGGPTNNKNLTDTSVGPANNGVLARVIEHTNNTFIGSGDLDFLLNTNGTLLAIQNMTWHGLQGLQQFPNTPLYSPYHPDPDGGALAGAGTLGTWGHERGLTFYRTQLAGHELPGFTPGAAYRVLEVMLGRVGSLSDISDFTTQDGMGDFNRVQDGGSARLRSREL